MAIKELVHTLKLLDRWCSENTPLCIYKETEVMLGMLVVTVCAGISTGWGSRIVNIILSDVPDGAITANSDSVGAIT